VFRGTPLEAKGAVVFDLYSLLDYVNSHSDFTHGNMGSDPADLAGTIGTWAAVLIALLALVAVLGPILVWAASRTEQNKALHATGDANQSFISSGFYIEGFDMRLMRRVKTPIVDIFI
jgi:hypothetical protein